MGIWLSPTRLRQIAGTLCLQSRHGPDENMFREKAIWANLTLRIRPGFERGRPPW